MQWKWKIYESNKNNSNHNLENEKNIYVKTISLTITFPSIKILKIGIKLFHTIFKIIRILIKIYEYQ